MKRNIVIACLLIAALMLTFFFATAAPSIDPGGPVDTDVNPTVEPSAEGRADLSEIAVDTGRQSAGAPNAAPPSAPAGNLTDPLTALIAVTVEPASGVAPPLAGLIVRASSLTSKASFESRPLGPDGRTELRVAEGGRYRVDVDPASVPDGFVASGKFRLGALDQTGVAGAYTEVEDGGAIAVTLRIFGTSSLSGLVTGPDGLPLAGAVVRAQGLKPGLAGLTHDAVTDRSGTFEIAGLLPFVYGVNLVDLGPNAHMEGDPVPQPPRQLFDLRLGSYAGVHFALGSGSRTVAGEVVDELGEPFEGVSVLAYYVGDEAHGVALPFQRTYDWTDHAFFVRTDAKGRFRVTGLGSVPIRIQVGSDEAKNGVGRRAKFMPPPIEVAMGPGSDGPVNVGRIELERSRCFQVEGRVELLSAEHPELRLKHSRLELLASPYGEQPGGEGESAGRTWRNARPFVDYDRRTGAFTLCCDTPLDECTLSVTPARAT